MSNLNGRHMNLAYDSHEVVKDLDLNIPEGEISVLIGGNGCGKSTILKALARLLKPVSGNVYLDGKEIHKQPTKVIAQKLSILPQSPLAPEGLTVKELCLYGRHPHKKLLSRMSAHDYEIVDWALRATGMYAFSERTLDALSGGQRQRAWIAMALAQDTEILLLDEPERRRDLVRVN